MIRFYDERILTIIGESDLYEEESEYMVGDEEKVYAICCDDFVYREAAIKCASDDCDNYMCATHVEDAITYTNGNGEHRYFCCEECVEDSGIELDSDWTRLLLVF